MDHEALKRDIAAYISGDDASGQRVCASLDAAVRPAVYNFLPPDDPDREDIIQDTLLAMLQYFTASGACPDNPEAFAVTSALNRCRNNFHWRRLRQGVDIDELSERLKSGEAGPLELLNDREIRELLAEGLDAIDPACRRLLTDYYLEEKSIEILRREANLTSVQGVYHRKNVCLKKITKFFNRRLLGGRYSRRTHR